MTAIEVFDTNVLIYALDALAPEENRVRAQTLLDAAWDHATGCLSTQVLQEPNEAVHKFKSHCQQYNM